MLEGYADRWALITGASSGIGAEFAHKLAARGMHLVLCARRRDLLEELARELDVRHGTRCEIIAGDLTDPGEPARLVDEIERRGIVLELLVNNAGFAVVAEIERTGIPQVLGMLRLNTSALTELTYRVLPGMLERRHGAILNLSSIAGFQPVAYMGAYAATKAYVLHFSEALWAEVRDRGVTVMALCPGVTRTGFFENAGVPNWLKKKSSHDPDAVVRAALKALDKGKQYLVVGWKNYFRSLIIRIASRKRVVNESMKYFRPTTPKQDKRKS